jgi:hemolysin activation/secretion protein
LRCFAFILFALASSFGFSDETVSEDIQVVKNPINAIFLLEHDENIDSTCNGVQIDLPVLGKYQVKLKQKLEIFISKEISEENIADIKKTILAFYSHIDRPFVVVSTPEQKIHQGAIKFIVEESRLGSVTIKGNKYFTERSLKKYIHTHRGEAIDSAVLERDVAMINRNPFRNASLIVKPGEEKDTTDLELWVADRRTYRVYMGIDNTGISATGHNRFFVGANLGNLWGLDHVVSYQFTTSFDPYRFFSHTATYTLPIFYRHLLTAYGGYSRIRPKTTIPNLNHKGKGAQGSFRYIVPFCPIGKYTHEFDWGYDYKLTNVNMSFLGIPLIRNVVNISQLMVKYQGQYNWSWINLPFSFEVYCSPGETMSDMRNSDFSALRYKAVNHYLYSILTVSPLFILPRGCELYCNFRNQLSTQNLISTEQYGLGGYYSVRGYSENEVYRDNAFLANFEFRFPLLNPLGFASNRLQFLTFLDAGAGWDTHPTPNLKNLQYLIGVGPGFRYSIMNYLTCRFDFGLKLHRTDLEPHAGYYKIHFSLIGSF